MTALRVLSTALLALACSGLAAAQPSLTTIRDTVYRADGSPFEGIAIIEWKSFQTADRANVGTQSVTARIVAGALYVRLAPTTASNSTYYLVRYNSNGQFQFSEIWSVPATSAILRLRDVRANLLPGGIVVGGGAGGIIIGNTGGGGGFADGETPGGAVNGVNNAFTLASAPVPASSLALYRNGLLQSPGVDYTVSGAIITFASASIPQTGDLLRAFYRSGDGGGGGGTATHSLLSASHSDTTPADPVRGALVTGQGSTATWGRLALGPANRCLVSNGTDAVWNTCLFTGFAPNSIPFTGAAGVLTENPSALQWNNISRKMTVGNNLSNRATLYVYDDSLTAVTELLVRAGLGQGSTPLQQWFANNGDAVAWVNADGGFNVRRILANSTNLRAAISDTGTPNDPSPSAASNGDLWYNRTSSAWKSREAGQNHTGPQIVCSTTGSTSAVSGTLGTCTVPSGFLLSGDRLEIHADYARTAGTGGFTIEVKIGGTVIASQAIASTDSSASLRISSGVTGSELAWSTVTIRPSAVAGATGSAGFTPGAGAQIQFNAAFAVGAATIKLHNFTVTRYPAQANP